VLPRRSEYLLLARMVFTVRMRIPRRLLLAAAAGTAATAATGALAGCDIPLPGRRNPPKTEAMTDAELMRDVAADSLDLAARYDATIARVPDLSARLTPIRDAHRDHATALARLIGSPAPGGGAASTGAAGSSAATTTTLKALAEGERAAAGRAAIAAIQVATFHAPLVGTIAAARASHVEALAGGGS
jgi:hypothetical protein